MRTLGVLIKRNTKLFFKDRGMFFTALITPGILLVLYSTFLAKVFKDSFDMSMPPGFKLSEEVLDGFVGSQVTASILAVCCITIAFSSNMLMVQDRANGTIKDIMVSPVRRSTLAISYYVASFFATLITCLVGAVLCLLYIYHAGWFMTGTDVFMVMLDVVVLVLFGTALSSVVNFFLSSQAQMSAVGTIISAGYGFICGAYMPISQFSDGLREVLSYLPGTYGTSIIRNHCLRGVLEEIEGYGVPDAAMKTIADNMDCNLYFRDELVTMGQMYGFVLISVLILVVIYVVMNLMRKNVK